MLLEEKYKELESKIGKPLLEALLSGNEIAVKSIELAGVSFKAMSPVAALAPLDPTKKKLELKAAPPMSPPEPAAGQVEGDPAEEAAETPEEEAAEPPDPGEDPAAAGGGGDADAIIQGLYDEVDAIIGRRMQSTSDEIVAKLQAIKSTEVGVASKEVTDLVEVQALALKETMNVLEKLGADNTALKARLDALEGNLPPAVAQRASAAKNNAVTDPALIDALKQQNQPNQDPADPFKSFYESWKAQGAPLPLNR